MINFKTNILLKDYSHYRIGGPARFFFEVSDIKDIKEVFKTFKKLFSENKDLKIFILGGGTNVLFSDEGFNGLVLKINFDFINLIDDYLIEAGAGVLMNNLVNYSQERSLSGLEWAAGLPGTLGGAIRGNAGAFGKEIKGSVYEVLSLEIKNPDNFVIRKNKDCEFNYRSSIFKTNDNEIILKAALSFTSADKELMKKEIEKNFSYRLEKQPLEYPNAGSVFKNVAIEKVPLDQRKLFAEVIKTDPFPVIPAAYLIHKAGLKGVCQGGAMISDKHSNFIVNIDNASSNDVIYLINLVKSEVLKQFDIKLEEEIQILSENFSEKFSKILIKN